MQCVWAFHRVLPESMNSSVTTMRKGEQLVEIQSRQGKKLQKNEELELGRTIQAGLSAQEELTREDLSPGEKASLQRRVRKGQSAEDALVSANINLVVSIAMQYRENYPYAPDLEECVQEGFLGLTVAARKYDPEKGNKFSTMAFLWVRQAISRGVNSGGKLVRLPENRITQYTKISKLDQELSKTMTNREEIDQEIVRVLSEKHSKFSKEDLHTIRNAASEHYSLNRRVNDDDSSSELMDLVSQTSLDDSAEAELMSSDTQDRLDECLHVLSDVQRDVISSNFEVSAGGTGEVMSPREVKNKHGIRAKEYRSILEDGIEILRGELKSRGLSFSDFL